MSDSVERKKRLRLDVGWIDALIIVAILFFIIIGSLTLEDWTITVWAVMAGCMFVRGVVVTKHPWWKVVMISVLWPLWFAAWITALFWEDVN